MAKLPTWSALMDQIADTLKTNAVLWQQFLDQAAAGTATPNLFFQDVVLTANNWMGVWATILGAGGSPTPPTAFILGNNWPGGTPPRSATVRLEVPMDPTTAPLEMTSPLVLVGGGTNPHPITLTALYEEGGSQVKVTATRQGVGQDPTPGMYAGAVYTTGETLLANVFLLYVP